MAASPDREVGSDSSSDTAGPGCSTSIADVDGSVAVVDDDDAVVVSLLTGRYFMQCQVYSTKEASYGQTHVQHVAS